MRDRKRRDCVDKTTTAAEAVRRLGADGDYVSFDFSSFTRGPLTLLGILDGLSVQEVTAEMSVKPRVAERVERLAPPAPRELDVLRGEIDSAGTIIGRTAKS
jgi:hypothetical protein